MARRNFQDDRGYGSEPLSILYGLLVGLVIVGAGAIGLATS